MNLDRMIHEQKNFAELEDFDIEEFLRERKFGSEHLNLEFKSGFPLSKSGGFKYQEICDYIIGLSNSEGGLLIYGVEDRIKNKKVPYPDYVCGLPKHPSLEDLSEWARHFIHPRVQSPSIRFFRVAGKDIAIIKVPPGLNKPYSFFNSKSGEMRFLRKTAGSLILLNPEEVREFYRDVIIEQSEKVVLATRGRLAEGTGANDRIEAHKSFVTPKLEDIENYGHVGIYCFPDHELNIPVNVLAQFVNEHRRSRFSEAFRLSPQVEFSQASVSTGYFPRAIRKDIKSTTRATLYSSGLICFDSQVDHLMDGDKSLNPHWLSYELQRHLQVTKALLENFDVGEVNLLVEFDFIQDFSLTFVSGGIFEEKSSKYQGGHKPLIRRIMLSTIHAFDGDKRNVISPVIIDIMDEVSRIFGFSKTLPGCWEQNGYLAYVKGLEHLR